MTMLLSPKEAALLVGAAERTIHHWCKTGVIEASRVGRRWFIPADAFLRRFGLDSSSLVRH